MGFAGGIITTFLPNPLDPKIKSDKIGLRGERMKIVKKIALGLLALVGIMLIGMLVWGYTPAKPMPEALAVLDSDNLVTVQNGRWLVFNPVGESPDTGFIFYPGGRVDYRAYTPYARALAEEGYLVVIPRMPLNLAVFGSTIAEKVISFYPQIENWAVGGHSLGGSMAASYLYAHPNQIDGLILLASYPAESNDLSDYSGAVTTISASLDGLATPTDIEASLLLLPQQMVKVVIEGGNHAYFGWYGDQKGDNPALITREEQQQIVIDASLELLEGISR